MATYRGSYHSTPPKRSGPPCRELRRHLDQFRNQLEKRGIRLEELIDSEQFFCTHQEGESEEETSSRHSPVIVEEVPRSYGPGGWKEDPEKLIATIEKGFDTVGIKLATLAAENDSLKRGLAEQVGAIGREVDPKFFHWILAILAMGSMRAAAKALGMGKSTLADRVKRHATRGGTYAFLHSLVNVRRRVLGTRRLEHYNESYLPHQCSGDGYDEEAFLRDLLNALESQNERNWPKVRREIMDLLAEQIG